MPDQPVTTDAPAGTADDHEKELQAEWGTYVALGPIEIPPLSGIRAFNKGEAVPKSHVDRGVVDAALVAKRGTKTAEGVTQ